MKMEKVFYNSKTNSLFLTTFPNCGTADMAFIFDYKNTQKQPKSPLTVKRLEKLNWYYVGEL